MRTRMAVAAVVLGSLGCAVGPDYEEPKTATAPAYENAAQEGVSADAAVAAWWREFGDGTLDDLVGRAIAGNRGVLVVTLQLLVLIGDALRDALDPRKVLEGEDA